MSTPIFLHDSTCCRFLGNSADKAYDLYVCETRPGDETFIARFGSAGPDYLSAPRSVLARAHRFNGPLIQAFRLFEKEQK